MQSPAKKILAEVAIKAGQLLAGLAAGYLLYRTDPTAPVGVKWIVGGMTVLILQMVETSVRLNRSAEQQREQLGELADTLARDAIERALLQFGLRYAGRTLSEEEIHLAWRQLTWFAQREYCATNYIDPPSFYRGRALKVLQLQKTKLAAQENFRVRKVLIWQDEAEQQSPAAREIVKLHLDSIGPRMELIEILHPTIAQTPHLAKMLAGELGGDLDFAIFDNLMVLVWRLDAHRKIASGALFVGPEAVTKFSRFFQALHDEVQPAPAS